MTIEKSNLGACVLRLLFKMVHVGGKEIRRAPIAEREETESQQSRESGGELRTRQSAIV